MARVVIQLNVIEKDALQQLADQELREIQAQAAVIIKRELERLGLLTPVVPQHSESTPQTQTASG